MLEFLNRSESMDNQSTSSSPSPLAQIAREAFLKLEDEGFFRTLMTERGDLIAESVIREACQSALLAFTAALKEKLEAGQFDAICAKQNATDQSEYQSDYQYHRGCAATFDSAHVLVDAVLASFTATEGPK